MVSRGFKVGMRVRIRDGRNITGIEECQNTTFGRYKLSAWIDPPILNLTVEPFESEHEAIAFLPRLKCGLMNATLSQQLVFKPQFEQINLKRFDNPAEAASRLFGNGSEAPPRVDGLGQGEGFYTYKTDEKISFITGFEASVTVSTAWDNVSDAIINGISHGKVEGIEKDIDLLTAFDLYVSSYYENSARARFITLVSCLEVLAPEKDRHSSVLPIFEAFTKALEDALAKANKGPESEALKAAIADSAWKKKASISEGIRELIRSDYSDIGIASEEHVKEVIKAYGIRSRLLHKGSVSDRELHSAMSTVHDAVKTILAARLGLAV